MTNTRWDSDTFVLTSQDTPLEFVADGPGMFFNPPFAIGAAYSNNFAGATSTTLYAYEMQSDFVTTVGGIDGNPSADGGQMFFVGQSGFVVPGNLGAFGFDISGPTGVAYVSSFAEELSGVRLFTMNLETGAMSDVGEIEAPGGATVIDISVSVPEPTSLMTPLTVASLNLLRRRGRSRRR